MAFVSYGMYVTVDDVAQVNGGQILSAKVRVLT